MRTLVPGYPAVMAKLADASTAHEYGDLFGGPARVLAGKAAGLDLFALDAPHLFDRPGNPYLGPDGLDWPDNARRFAALDAVGADIGLGAIDAFRPQVVHAHDWQAALAPAYLHYADGPRPGTAITIHNIAFQGHFPASIFAELGLPASALTIDGVEYFGGVGYLKAGLLLSDRITTVSPTYAREIMTPEFGMALDGLLRTRAAVVQGIVNGIDDTVWNPATDAALAQNYSALRIDMRVRNKTALQTRMGLAPGANRPLFGVVSRLSDQKGLDLLLQALPGLIAKGGQLALLGSGDPALEAGFAAAAAARPDSVGCVIGYDEKLAHLFQAGADFIVVPSRFEPCGLTQLCALRYGAVPIVARVGGLADTVIDANEAATAAGVATGVQFFPPSVEALAHALDRALEIGRDPAMIAAPQAQRHALGRLLARPGAAIRRALSRSRRGLPNERASGGPRRRRWRRRASRRRSSCPTPKARRCASTTAIARSFARRWPATRTASCAALAPGFGAGARYGFRVDGPFDPARGARFDASKLLADPYAWRFDRPFRLHPSMFEFGDDSGPFAPKAIAGAPPAGEPGFKRVAADALVIYELNLRGFSRLNPAIPEAARGTFAGLAHPASIAHLAALGVTAVEIMPADAFVDERHLPPLGLSNAWGYNSVVFGSPDPRLAPGGWAEVRAATDALHAAGMEAILDVVFNHDGESDQFGPTLSFRGLDNAALFRLDPRDPARLRQRHRHRQLPGARPPAGHRHGDRRAEALDDPRRLRRLPLRSRDHARPPRRRLRPEGAVLPGARRRSGPGQGAPDRRAVGRRPGRLPARPVRPRRSPNGTTASATPRAASGAATPELRGEIATRIAGSRDVFDHAAAPSKGVNFVVAHDGFTLARPRLLRAQAQRGQRRAQSRRDGQQSQLEPRRRGADRRSGDFSRACARRAQSPDPAPRLARDADALHGHGARLQPGRQQQRLRPGQRDERDRLARRRRFADRLHRPAHQGAAQQSRAVARRLPDRRAVRRERPRPMSNGATPTGR